MKKRLMILALGSLLASNSTQAQQADIKVTAVPYEEILNLLKDDNILVILDLVRAKGIAQGIAGSLQGIQTLDLDIKKATEASKNFRKRVGCIKLPATIEAKVIDPATKKPVIDPVTKKAKLVIDPATGKPKIINVRSVVPGCADVGCAGDRGACIKLALQDLRILLKPLVQDVFTGYKDSKGVQQPGISYALFDIIGQPQFKNNKDFEKTVEILQVILNVLDVIEKAIPASSTKS